MFVKVDPASGSGYRGGSPPLSNRPVWTENLLPNLRGSILTHTAVTILVNGEDLFPAERGDARVASCRIYATPEGPKNHPSAAMLREALAERSGLSAG